MMWITKCIIGFTVCVLYTHTAVRACGTYSNPQVVTLYSGQQSYITSPNYPGDYPANKLCYWRIEAPFGSTIAYWFSSGFRLESSCSSDYVKLYDSYFASFSLIGTYCGTTYRSGSTSSGYLSVKFRSDGLLAYRGFKLNVGAGGEYPGKQAAETTGLIVGIVFAVIIVLAILIGVILCVYCFCIKSSTQPGAVIHQPSSGGGTVVVQNRVSPQQPPPYSASQPPPPPYGQYAPPTGQYASPPPGLYPSSGQYPAPPPGQYPPPGGPAYPPPAQY